MPLSGLASTDTIRGTDGANKDRDNNKILVVGALLGVAGAAFIAMLQEGFHSRRDSKDARKRGMLELLEQLR
jgi:hypothetical protein